jgi:hypothetical protein
VVGISGAVFMKGKVTPDRWRAIRSILIEVIVYGILVTLYAASILQFLSEPLADLYKENLTLYAWLALALIVIQGVVLEGLTSFLLDRLRLPRFH